jgi:hypothetical protein
VTTTILRTVQCDACGHRIGVHQDTCPYCGERARAVNRRAAAKPAVARPVGRCVMCGGRMTRARGRLEKLLAKVGIRMRRAKGRDLECSSCGHRERFRWAW